MSKLQDGRANVIMLQPETLSYQDRFGSMLVKRLGSVDEEGYTRLYGKSQIK